MKQNERVIKKGDYYELETIEDLMMQQKIPKKEEVQSSSNIPVPNQNILTELPSRSQALKKYQVASSAKIRTDDFGLEEYQNSLEEVLKLPIKDEERLQIEKILKEIATIKNNAELPLNKLPQKQKQENFEIPKSIQLHSDFNIEKLQQNVKKIEGIKYLELSRLQNIVEILLGNDTKTEASNQPQNSQIDDKTKEQIEKIYNSLSQLQCLNNLSGIITKISANQTKYVEMSNWVSKTQEINLVNKEILDEFENDELILNQLQENFKKNVQSVREIVKKLSD